MAHIKRLAALALFALAFLATPAIAEEVINSYDVAIIIGTSGDLVVTETITVTAESKEIRHGIYRDFPAVILLPDGSARRARFEVLRVTRDGIPEPHFEEAVGGGRRLYLGDRNVLLRQGTYTYEIAYRTPRQLNYLADSDQLSWPVVGTDWGFAIKMVSASVTLPRGATLVQWRAVAMDDTGDNIMRLVRQDSKAIVFQATRPLGPYEGIMLIVDISKGA